MRAGERVAELHVGQPVEVMFAANRGTRYESGHVREVRRMRGTQEIRAVVVVLQSSGRLCVCSPASLRYVVTEAA